MGKNDDRSPKRWYSGKLRFVYLVEELGATGFGSFTRCCWAMGNGS
jgi:hypothetical protein